MMLIYLLAAIFLISGNVEAFNMAKQSTRASLKMSANIFDISSILTSELFSSPSARYNGELIQQGLKAVEPIKRVANYEYGAVNNDATPVLATFLLLSVALAALVPYVLSIGEGAAAQQREREDETYIGENQFAKKARQEKAKKEARKGTR